MNKSRHLSMEKNIPNSNKEMIKPHGPNVCEPNNLSAPIRKFNLEGNQFCGNILVGNYSYLTQLEVTNNEIDVLDLSSLLQLESLKCSQNKMTGIIVNGTNLTSIEAIYSELQTINIAPPPTRLKNLDISHNYLIELPHWIHNCSSLLALNASHNQLKTVNKYQATWNLKSLRILHLGFNQLRNIDGILENSAQVEKLYLQSNEILELPQKIFSYTGSYLTELNVSCNRLTTFPKNIANNLCHLEKMFATSNYLNNSFFGILSNSHQLRILHLAYNKLTFLPEKILINWPNLEELVLSGNHLQQLPKNLSLLRNLKVLRLHSNLIISITTLSNLCSLQVLDLAHNHFDKIDLQSIVPKSLKYLDLSCNKQLQVDNNQVGEIRSQRNWSLVDVSGKNRLSLPTKHENIHDSLLCSPPWKIGFSETPGSQTSLRVSQIRLPLFKANEGLFGMFESENSSKIPRMWVKVIPKMFVQEKTIKETIGEYIKYAQLSAHYKISNNGIKYGFSAALCHIAKQKFNHTSNTPQKHFKGKKFTLCVASLGSITVFLIRKTSIISLTLGEKEISLQSKTNFSPEPLINEIALENDDEYLVICNEEVSKVMDIERIAREIRRHDNVILSSKRIQDVAQSFGANLNLSTIVVKFRNIGTDVNSLINELKQTVHKKSLNENIYSYLGGDRQDLFYRQMLVKSNRLSQSNCNNENISVHSNIQGKNELEYIDETDSVLSGEQYKCWEYMLEQNTQLLFDKELNTISKIFSKNKNLNKKRNSSCSEPESSPQFKEATKKKLLSISSPQLCNEYDKNQTVTYQSSFFSKNFKGSGSLVGPFYTKPCSKIGNTPKSAYFGSIQRLKPYNLETNFAMVTERPFLDIDYAEHDDRVGQYWAIASTEL